MEADSTTYDSSPKEALSEPCLPFPTCLSNFKLYKDFTGNDGERSIESQIVERLQEFGLLPKKVKCPTNGPECKVICKSARVVDRVQWLCSGCGKKQPIRTGSFFLRLQCTLLQSLQIILAWSEDADCDLSAQHFGVKPKVANTIYDRLDDIAVREQKSCRLGGENSVVLAEMYPDCLNQFSPDTTDQPHVHRILMLADTNHIPTSYQLHVIMDDLKKNSNGSLESKSLKSEVEEAIKQATLPDSTLVTSGNVPAVAAASTVQHLLQHCDADMQHFLRSRIWRQATALCAASRDACAGAATAACAACAGAAQRYLHAALHRLRHADRLYHRVLTLLADQYTGNDKP